jgi:TP901 family phage tail tape measure protein
VQGVSRYTSDAKRVEQSTAKIGTAASKTEKQTKKLSDTLRSSGTRMRETGTQATFLGAAILGIIGGPALLAASFQSELTKIVNLTKATTDSMDDMRKGILDVSRETGRGPAELAKALFVLESGGISGARGIETLRQVAIAATAGLGQSADVARLASQALTAFGDSGVDAEKVINVLIATAREGQFETAQLASVFSRTFGQAAALGIRIEDLGAFVATYTRQAGNAADASTALRSILTLLGDDSQQTKEALDEMQIPLKELNRIAREEGLAQALTALTAAADAKGGIQALSQAVPNIRALAGVLNVAGKQGEAFLETQAAIRGEMTATADIMANLADDPAFKLNQAFNDLKIAAIEFGAIALPVFGGLVSVISGLAGIFTSFPTKVKQVAIIIAVVIGAFLTVAGLAAIVAGSFLVLSSAGITAAASMTAMGAAASFALGPIGILIGVIAVATAGFFAFKKIAEGASKAARMAEVGALASRIAALAFSEEELEGKVSAASQALDENSEAQEENFLKQTAAINATREGARAGIELKRRLDELDDELKELKDDAVDLEITLDANVQALGDFSFSADVAANAARNLDDALTELEQREADKITAAEREVRLVKARAIAANQGIEVGRLLTDRQIDLILDASGVAIETRADERQGVTETVDKLNAAAGGAGDGVEKLTASAQRLKAALEGLEQRQGAERAEALIRELTGNLGPGSRTLAEVKKRQSDLDREFARIAPIIEERLGVIPILIRDIFDRVVDEAEDAAGEVGGIGGILGLLIARRIAEGQPVGTLIATSGGASGFGTDSGRSQIINIDTINIGEGSTQTAGEVAIGVGDGIRGETGGQ